MKRGSLGAWVGGICLAVATVACGSGGGGSPTPVNTGPASIGAGEGALNIIVWAGYAENGSTDPKVNWVAPFEQKTGCKTTAKIAGTSDEMVSLMQTGQYDGVSASGNATLRLMVGGNVAPVNVNLDTNYADINSSLKDQPYNTYQSVHYGVPHGWGANLLMSRTDIVKPSPDSWGAVFDPNSPYKGKITAYDDPIYIADAALYLKATRPDRHHLAGDHQPASLRQEPHSRDSHRSQGGIHRLVRHLDGLRHGSTPQLHVHVDELGHLARCAVAGGAMVRRGPGQPQGLPGHRQGRPQLLQHLPRGRLELPQGALAVEGAAQRLR
jgi:hypothetical protein